MMTDTGRGVVASKASAGLFPNDLVNQFFYDCLEIKKANRVPIHIVKDPTQFSFPTNKYGKIGEHNSENTPECGYYVEAFCVGSVIGGE